MKQGICSDDHGRAVWEAVGIDIPHQSSEGQGAVFRRHKLSRVVVSFNHPSGVLWTGGLDPFDGFPDNPAPSCRIHGGGTTKKTSAPIHRLAQSA